MRKKHGSGTNLAGNQATYAPVDIISPETRQMLAQCAPVNSSSKPMRLVPSADTSEASTPLTEPANDKDWKMWKSYRGLMECLLLLIVFIAAVASIWFGISRNHDKDEDNRDRKGTTFELISAGTNQICRGLLRGNGTDFTLHNGVTSLKQCRYLCLQIPSCKGIEYSNKGQCKVWTGVIRSKQPMDGYKCLRTIPAGCCRLKTAKCNACLLGQSIEEYCLEAKHSNSSGCSGFCGFIEANYSYPGGDLYRVNDTKTPEACCEKCRADKRCSSWTHSPDLVCHLKDQVKLSRHYHQDYISGLPGIDSMTHQIKNRHGICIDAQREIHMSVCNGELDKAQQWSYDRSTKQIVAMDGTCLETPKSYEFERRVHLRPCNAKAANQQWEHDGFTGSIQNKNGLCLGAPDRNKAGSNIMMARCNSFNEAQQWSLWNVEKLNDHDTYNLMKHESHLKFRYSYSLFCFSIIVLRGGELELDLVMHQFVENTSIFACDESTVYSNESLNLSGIQTGVVDVDLFCPLVGNKLWNTPVFMELWHQVIRDGRFKLHDWTVKVDPDSVFFPMILRQFLYRIDQDSKKAEKGMFLSNCECNCGYEFRGPLEVLSRKAVEAYAKGRGHCSWKPQEDRYLEQCLLDLHVKKVPVFDILEDRYCHPVFRPVEWPNCTTAHAAFHPFKTVKKYNDCLNVARNLTSVSNYMQTVHWNNKSAL